MPVAAPIGLHAEGLNATAMDIFWTPVPDDRNSVKGKIGGYQVSSVKICIDIVRFKKDQQYLVQY